MTYQQIKQLTLQQLQESGADQPSFEPMLDHYINDAYGMLLIQHVKPLGSESVTVHDQLITQPPIGMTIVRGIYYGTQQCMWKRDPEGIHILSPTLPNGATLSMIGIQMPPALQQDDDIPEFEPEHLHTALADYATYAILGIGTTVRQRRAQFFHTQWLIKKSLVKSAYLGPADEMVRHAF